MNQPAGFCKSPAPVSRPALARSEYCGLTGIRPWLVGLLGLLAAMCGEAADSAETWHPRPSVRLELNPGEVVAVGQFFRGDNGQIVKFDHLAQGRYFALETLSAQDGRPYAAVAELNLLDANGRWLSRTNWHIAYADSEERERENGAAENVLDSDPDSYWHTQWSGASPDHPHHLVLDLGRSQTLSAFCYLPRAGSGLVGGRIKDYRVYVGNDLVQSEGHGEYAPDKVFLFGYFTPSEDGLHLGYSLNGYHWDTLNQGNAVLRPQIGGRIMRDPSLSRAPDGLFHLVWTAAWNGNYIGHATSRDLVHWSEQAAIPVMTNFPGTLNCWAPEMYWDTNHNQALVFWSSMITNGYDVGVGPITNWVYCTTTRDFQTFTPAKLMYGPSFSVLDATLIPDQGRFRLIFKDDTMSRLRSAVADQPEGPYGPAGPSLAPDVAEGPALLRVNGQAIVCYHLVGTHQNGAISSTDLEHWKDISAGIMLPPGSMQGSFIELEGDQLKTLQSEGYLETGTTAVASELGLGNWIWTGHFADRQTCRLWHSFRIPDDYVPTHAQLTITADNGYTAYLDGQEIGRGGDPNNLTEYDLTWLMSPGRHVLAVEAFNDAFDAGVIAGLRVDAANGKKLEVYSDASWWVVPEGDWNWKTAKQAAPDWTLAHVVGYAGKMWWRYPTQITRVPPLLPVIKHFWQHSWFLVLLLSLCAIVLIVSLRQALQLALQTRSHRQLERERARIASDLHDDLGSGLTQMTLLGELLLQEKALSDESRGRLQKLCGKARAALKSMDEIIWTVNPRRDTLPDFVAFILEYAQEYLASTTVRCRLEVPDNLPSVPLDLPARRNLLLAFKEAVRNVARHSGASELFLKIEASPASLSVELHDNGKGFALATGPSARNGMSNMRERLADIGGHCLVQSRPGEGCRIIFTLPLSEPEFSSKKWLARSAVKLFRHT
jgi:signal transduction histidine kinase